jgi:gamma-glutamyl hercynylcysteine S-oxide synthase
VIMMMSMIERLSNRPVSGASATELAAQLCDIRSRTLCLTNTLSAEQLMGPMLPIVNPVLWEIGHVGWFHEYWTLRHVHAESAELEAADSLWNSSTVAHATRWHLDLPSREGVFSYLANILDRQLARLAEGVERPGRYFYELAIRHEDMHVEALTYMRQTLGYERPQVLGAAAPDRAGLWAGDADVPGGMWQLGSTAGEGFIFDNEKWAHAVEIAPFKIAKAPVTNVEFAAFVEDGGYRRREFWDNAGWAWRERKGAVRPVYWLENSGGKWTWRRYGEAEPLAPHAPVSFVNWYEARAWCNWAKRRLPSEAEWEVAAVGEATSDGSRLANVKRQWPWGNGGPDGERANLDFAFDAPNDVAACAAGDSAFGCRQMTGNVWEWTVSDFLPFAGFAVDPYEDYSLPWFNTRKVLRGGSFATTARIARPRYRNFFTPDRNDVVAGFRSCPL